MIDSFLSASGKDGFGERIIVSTTDKWNANAEDAIKAGDPVRRIGLSDLEASARRLVAVSASRHPRII